MRRILLPAAAAVVLAGCGSSAEPAAEPTPTTPTPTATTQPPPPLDGENAVDDVSDFRCTVGPDGRWDATGMLRSSHDRPADFTVTVVVASPGTTDVPGRMRLLSDVEPGVETAIDVDDIEPTGDDAACQLQVVRLDR